MSNRLYIADLGPADLVEGVYAIQNCQLGQTKTGKPYIKCLIADKTGRAPGRMWNASEQLFKMLPTDGFVRISGQTQPYQGEMQIVLQDMRAAEPSDEELSDLLPSTWRDIDEMFGQLQQILGRVRDPGLKALIDCYLNDEALMRDFKQAPAAMNLHHAFLGGLLEHTLSLLNLAEAFCPLYPQLNPDIIRVGLFIHDLGKCCELTWRRGFAYTDDGQLVGHIARGMVWLNQKSQQAIDNGAPLKRAVVTVLEHIILSHHGRPEYGALKIPATPEALAISLLDNMDAKMQMAISATRLDDAAAKDAELGGNFTEKIWALETRMFRPDPTSMDE